MRIDIMTLFPDTVGDVLSESILGRAQERGILRIETHQIRDYTANRQNQVDDYPYGGGHGAVLQADPLYRCWCHVCDEAGAPVHTIYLSPAGHVFDQSDARRLAKMDNLVFVCGHYEGIDQRFIDECVDEELSIGDFVVTGGEIPAMAITDAVCRLVPGVLSDAACFERLLQSTGRTIYTLFTQGTGAVLNIIFDPILIFGLFGLPRMEVAGAAVATVLGQIVAFILAMILNHRKNPDVRLHLRGFRPDWKLIGRILAIGVPSMIMVAIGSVMYYGMNLVLMRFEHVRVGLGEVGTAVFGAYYKLQSFIFMPVFGINNAALAIAAYNYGARKPKRILGVLKCGILGATALMVIGVAAFQLIPQVLLGLFNANADMLAVGDPALRTMSLAFVFAGACIIVGGVFQALGNSVYSMIASIARQLVVLLPVAYLLSLSGNLDAVWFAFPIAEVASLAMTVILFLRLYRKKIRPLSRMPAAE